MQQKKSSKTSSSFKYAFFTPSRSFKKSGQYVNGTVFIEGLVYFEQKWFLYYGCADSRVGVAIFDPHKPAPPDPMPQLY